MSVHKEPRIAAFQRVFTKFDGSEKELWACRSCAVCFANGVATDRHILISGLTGSDGREERRCPQLACWCGISCETGELLKNHLHEKNHFSGDYLWLRCRCTLVLPVYPGAVANFIQHCNECNLMPKNDIQRQECCVCFRTFTGWNEFVDHMRSHGAYEPALPVPQPNACYYH